MTVRIAATLVVVGFFLCAIAIAAVSIDDRNSGKTMLGGLIMVGGGALLAIWAS